LPRSDIFQFAHSNAVLHCSRRDSFGNSIEPAGNIPASNRTSPFGQNKENGLKGIFGKMLIADQSLANAENHHTVSPNQQFERFLVASCHESPEQITIRCKHCCGLIPSRTENSLQVSAKSAGHSNLSFQE